MLNNISDTQKFIVNKDGNYCFDSVPLDDPRPWGLISSGRCLGIFQLESQLGRSYAKRFKPNSIKELSVLIAILRPICLESGLADKICKIKNGEEQPEYIHPSLEPILKDTYGCLVYQESIMKICQDIAGFTELQADDMRKATGKKSVEMMAIVKKMFMEGCQKKGIVSDKIAEEIFSWIEKSVRFSFNFSHSCSYSFLSYWTGYQKSIFPLQFYTAALTYSTEKIDPKLEVQELVNDAKVNFGIKVSPPKVQEKNENFVIRGDKEILFGLSHIRGVGSSAITKLLSVKNLATFSDFILGVHKIGRGICESLIKSGSCDLWSGSRSQMLRTLHILFGRSDENKVPEYSKLTPNEYKTFAKHINLGFPEALKKIIEEESCIKKREPTILRKIELISEKLEDTNRGRALWEKIYLGINLTCSAADDVEVVDPDTKSCKEVLKLKDRSKATIHVVLDGIKERLTSEKAKTPNVPYAIIKVSDNTGCLELMCWPDVYQFVKDTLVEDAVASIKLVKQNWGGREQIVVKELTVIG